MAALSDTLVVPVDLAALCVGETDVNGSATQPYGTKDFSRLAPDFSLLPYAADGTARNSGPYLSSQVLPGVFQKASDPLDTGIHLHWALPETLTHGTQNTAGSISFQAAPNRWLVLRIATNTAVPQTPETSLKAWILESDRLWDGETPLQPTDPVQNAASLAVPIEPTPNVQPNKSWKTLGRVFALDGWAEDPSAQRANLTALGYGEATYAATYQLCPNVFGFWDTLADLDPAAYPPASTRVSYLLAGWHADAKDDPLTRIAYPAGATLAEKIAAIAAAYGWSFPADGLAAVPGRTVYTSLLTNIAWDKTTHYITPRQPGPDGIKVAIGNTTPEALSALIAAQPDFAGLQNVELILNALQLGLLTRIELPGGLRDVEDALHKNGFASASQGTVWTIEAATGADLGSAEGAPSLAELPPETGDALNALNLAQAQADELERNCDSLRARIFADWVRYMQIQYSPPPPGGYPVTADQARQFITAETGSLNTLLSDLQTARQSVVTAQAALLDILDPRYSLTTTDGARFYAPTDPALLFSGEEVRPAYRAAPAEARDPAGNMVCRVATTLLSSLTATSGQSQFKIDAASLPSLALPAGLPVAEAMTALTGEAFLADPVQAPVAAAAFARLGGAGNPALADFAGFTAQIEAAQAALYGTAPEPSLHFTGTPPSPLAFKPWSRPWLPIILQWEVEHFPNALPPYPPGFLTANYTFGPDELDLQFNGSIPADKSNSRTYEGTIVLTGNTEINIRQQIEAYLTNFPDSDIDAELREILDNLHPAMQAQALSGFNQSLLMLARILQMGVSDPLGILKGVFFANFTNVTVKEAVAAFNTDSPLGNNTFSPLRNGGFRVTRVRIIDTFGQPLDLPAPAIVRAENLTPPAEREELINLPLRITQPSRLLFNWLSADNDAVEMNSHPATTPVFGWVLFNRLDQALMIYDESGTALGSFNLLGPFWQGAPGNQATFAKPIEEVFADANPHLRAFALGMSSAADPVAYLGEMLKAIDKSLGFIAPGQNQPFDSLSILIGRPLALTRASLDLQLLGLPAMNQSLASFAAATGASDPLQRDDGGATTVEIPVVLGAFDDIDDGLTGYFIDDGSENAYQTFYTEAADPGDSHGVKPPAPDQITLVTSAASAPVTVAMLIDPNAPVHARTGLLPLTELAIPSSMISNDLARIAVTFLTTPVLLADEPQVPVPPESGYVWNWVTQIAGAGQWSVTPVAGGDDVSLLPQQIQEGWLKLEHAPDTRSGASPRRFRKK
ncbi:hypothetical protein ADZ37_11405 [Pannonibacter phragmitetus]|uniref:hypothetical protein n=1 Tax=Pannonibacter phragmitetus TaxID=121719 RepID=UPI00067ACB86|nr:hypothetical protein [Pannonibacter phragmitetus]KND18968.1 hypothetical protein ADZ37_11405 [Pannonibacter phragmitetus]